MEIHFDTMPMDTAVYEQGGPLQHTITATGAGTGYRNEHKVDNHAHPVPDSGNGGVSGLAKELHGKMFKRGTQSDESTP